MYLLPANEEQFPQANVIHKGNGSTVKDLPTCVAKLENDPEVGSVPRVVISKWKLTPEDIQKINETGELYLVVVGGQPPVRLYVDNPFEEGFEPIDQNPPRDLDLPEHLAN